MNQGDELMIAIAQAMSNQSKDAQKWSKSVKMNKNEPIRNHSLTYILIYLIPVLI
jgi:hypothetical protein